MIRGESNCDDKSGQKVFKWSEVHLSEMTCSKIHTLEYYGKSFDIPKIPTNGYSSSLFEVLLLNCSDIKVANIPEIIQFESWIIIFFKFEGISVFYSY